MNNQEYNSLTDKLIQQGILKEKNSIEYPSKDIDNFYGIKLDEDMSNSPFIEKKEKSSSSNKNEKISTKRLNQFDLEMLNQKTNPIKSKVPFKIIQRFINIKEKMAAKGALNTAENFLFAFFPKLYKAKLVKDSMKKLSQLDIDAKKLLDKTIPYGESEMRYADLVKYLKYANEIQTEIKKELI